MSFPYCHCLPFSSLLSSIPLRLVPLFTRSDYKVSHKCQINDLHTAYTSKTEPVFVSLSIVSTTPSPNNSNRRLTEENMPTLTITPTPFRSSHLTIPHTPFTPRLPISPPARPQTKPTNSTTKSPLSVPPPPQEPLKWLWQCHCCSRIYHLGTTRRCLDDGHYFCAGAPVTKRDRKTGLRVTRKSRACASEFDYQGWKAWGSWRRDVDEQRAVAAALQIEDVHADSSSQQQQQQQSEDVVPRPLFAPAAAAPQEGKWLQGIWTRKSTAATATTTADSTPAPPDFWEKDCWNTCDYPSECRWGKQFGAQQTRAQSCSQPSPSTTTATATSMAPPQEPPPPPASMVAEPVAHDLGQPSSSFEGLCSLPATIEETREEGETDFSSSSSLAAAATSEATAAAAAAVQDTANTKKPTFDDLLESAKRRKRRSSGPPPSPLASNPPSPVEQQSPENSLSTSTTMKASSASGSSSSSHHHHHTLARTFDDFELDVRKSIGRASLLLNDFVLGLKSSGGGSGGNGSAAAATEDERAEAFVRGSVEGNSRQQQRQQQQNGRRRDRNDGRVAAADVGGEEESRSLSD